MTTTYHPALLAHCRAERHAFEREYARCYPDSEDERDERWCRTAVAVNCGELADEVVELFPLVAKYDHPQIAPQEYECGCVAILHVTAEDTREGGRPFELRLAAACDGPTCAVERQV